MDIISAQLGGNNRADHWIIENRASNMQSLSGSDFGLPIRINSSQYTINGNWPRYRHTFAADFNRDSVPDLVSFSRDYIEFQTNTVAREPGILEVTQLKSFDDTTQCGDSYGDTLLYKVYVKGLGVNQENAYLTMRLPRWYRFKVTFDSITPPTSWSSMWTSMTTHNIAYQNNVQDTLFVWVIAGKLFDVYGNGNTLANTYTLTDSIEFYFARQTNRAK